MHLYNNFEIDKNVCIKENIYMHFHQHNDFHDYWPTSHDPQTPCYHIFCLTLSLPNYGKPIELLHSHYTYGTERVNRLYTFAKFEVDMLHFS